MKRCAVILLILTLLLTGCGKAEKKKEEAFVPGVDPKSGEWVGRGSCWKVTPAEIDFPEYCMTSFLHGGERYFITSPFFEEARIMRGEREIFRTADFILNADTADEGLRLATERRDEDGAAIAAVTTLSYDGEILDRWEAKLPENCFPRDFAQAGEAAVLNCSDRVRVFDASGAFRFDIPHAEWSGRLIRNGGKLYFVDQNDSGGGEVSLIDLDRRSLTPLFSWPSGTICRGDGESAFFLMQADGICRLSDTGEASPLVIWEECGIGITGVSALEAEPDGSFLLSGSSFAPMRLSPALPQELKPRTRLTLGVMGLYGPLLRAAADFNARSPDCYVQVIDLREGDLTPEEAVLRLNTQLISGQGPDMLAFGTGRLSPFPFLRKGMLRDLEQDIEADPDIKLADVRIAGPIMRDCGGLYLLAADFSIETRLALQETFGDVSGWSFDDYLRLARATPDDRVVMYNLTRDYFLTEGAARFMRQAIDWQAGTCDFDNADFIKLLEAVRDVKETPEDQQNLVFGDNLLAGGYMATELTMLNDVTSLARSTRHVGRPAVVVGFPTPDGSCGTDMGIFPVGVLASTAHPEACWAFLKDWLLHPSAIPAYQPLIEKDMEEARQIAPGEKETMFSDRLSSPITEEEIRQFYDLLEEIEHTALYDETVLNIIREEASPFLAGQRSAEETARIVQSRVSLYVSEQA